MLTREENELLTQTGPGTPCGELLRRYWQPICYAGELSAEKPTKRVKILHQELVVFRTPTGDYGCEARDLRGALRRRPTALSPARGASTPAADAAAATAEASGGLRARLQSGSATAGARDRDGQEQRAGQP
jgi:hypothetical protein